MYGKIVKPALAATFALLFSGLVVSFKFDDDSDLDTYITVCVSVLAILESNMVPISLN